MVYFGANKKFNVHITYIRVYVKKLQSEIFFLNHRCVATQLIKFLIILKTSGRQQTSQSH